MARSEPFWTPCAPCEARHRTRVQLRMWRTWSPELVETYRVRRVVFESWQGASSVQRLRRRLQGVSVEEFFSDRLVLPRDLQGKVGRARKVRGEAEVVQREARLQPRRSGRFGSVDLKNRTEKRRNRHVWMNCRVIRDREAPGSNPGPPTKI
jgi:hypothetical protein